MLNQIDGAYVAAEIRMIRQVKECSILIVEGVNDEKIFSRFIDGDKCEIEIAFNKSNALDALDLLEDEGFPGVVAVVDADFDRVLGRSRHLENLCMTETHDLDLVVLLSSAFDFYIKEYCDNEKLHKSFEGDPKKLRTKIFNACLPIAYCRLASERRGMNISFKDLNYGEFIDKFTLEIDKMTLFSIVLSKSNVNYDVNILSRLVDLEESYNFDLLQLVNGHDATAVLGIALQEMVGRRREVHTWSREVESALRLAFDWESMTRTEIYEALKGWEVSSAPYIIFRQ
ncbi:MAG: DUF4435 domain-containing protein [Negativicutes bacterium]|nr:DUF4435 domain-containing protein [Negativicutes bacterium]